MFEKVFETLAKFFFLYTSSSSQSTLEVVEQAYYSGHAFNLMEKLVLRRRKSIVALSVLLVILSSFYKSYYCSVHEHNPNIWGSVCWKRMKREKETKSSRPTESKHFFQCSECCDQFSSASMRLSFANFLPKPRLQNISLQSGALISGLGISVKCLAFKEIRKIPRKIAQPLNKVLLMFFY